MRNAVIGGLLGVLLGCGVLIACGGSGGSGGGTPLVVGESLLAAAHVDGHATTPVVNRFVNHVGAGVTVTREGQGIYVLDFGFDVSNRFFSACAGRHTHGLATQIDIVATVVPHGTDPNKVLVAVYSAGPDATVDSGYFYITVF